VSDCPVDAVGNALNRDAGINDSGHSFVPIAGRHCAARTPGFYRLCAGWRPVAAALAGPGLVWLHLPALVWGVFVEASGWVCPLTPLENYFRVLAGGDIYREDFIARYLLPLVYPAGLTQTIQMMLAGVLIVLNVIIYSVIIRARRRAR
jgi:hypothetical protein